MKYEKYKTNGFSTPTRKFELYSTLLEKWGYDPLPQYREPPEGPYSTPELYKEYPYILITGARSPGFFHTENRQVPWLRELERDPVVEIHPDTAKAKGIRQGDWVVIESPRGKVRQRAKLFAGMDPRRRRVPVSGTAHMTMAVGGDISLVIRTEMASPLDCSPKLSPEPEAAQAVSPAKASTTTKLRIHL